MNQLAIDFAATHARRSDPRTSKDAAKAAEKFAASHAGRILECLKAGGPMTVDQIAVRVCLLPHQVGRRMKDLETAGKALPTGLVGLHHDDYDKPLVVRWLCYSCHGREHRKVQP